MNEYKKEILDDLTKILEKIIEFEKINNDTIFSDEVLIHLSYTMEHVAGVEGITDEEIEKYRPNYFNDKNN